MAGFPCCCSLPSGGFWDCYNVNLTPYILDMDSATTLTSLISYPTTVHYGYSPEYYAHDYLRSFTNQVPSSLNYYQIGFLSKRTDEWFIDQRSPQNTSGIVLSRRALNFAYESFYDDKTSTYVAHNRGATNGEGQLQIYNNGLINLHSDTERILQFNHEITTGVLITQSSIIPKENFNAYQVEWSDRITHAGTFVHGGQMLESRKFVEPDNGYDDIDEFHGATDVNGSQIVGLNAFEITGQYSQHNKHKIYSIPYIDYALAGNPTVTGNYYDVYGSDDSYVGAAATYDTGNGRYSIAQPFFTGVMNHIVHSLDLPTGLFNISTMGYRTEYSGLPETGNYVATYGYSFWDAGFTNYATLTGIHSTGTLDFYANNIRNQVPNAGKFPQPLVSSFSLIESFVNNYRFEDTYRIDKHVNPLLKVDLVIKPDEVRAFRITLNEKTIELQSNIWYWYNISNAEQGAASPSLGLFFDLDGSVSFEIAPELQGYLRFIEEPFVNYTIDASGFYHLSLYADFNFWFPISEGEYYNAGWPKLTGVPSPLVIPNDVDPGDGAAYRTQEESIYAEILANIRNSGSGYLPFDAFQERAIYIWPFNDANDTANATIYPQTYIGNSGDGFYFQEAKVSLYERSFSTNVVNTNVQNKTFVAAATTEIMDQSRTDSEFLLTGFPGSTDPPVSLYALNYDYFPINILSYSDTQVNIINRPLNYRNWNKRNNFSLSNINYDFYNFNTAIENISSHEPRITVKKDREVIIIETGTKVSNVTPLIQGYEIQPKYLVYSVTGNIFESGINITDINVDSFHYADKLALKDFTLLGTPDIKPSLLSTEHDKSLVLMPHENCWPILYSMGDSPSNMRSDVTGISYDYYLSSDFTVDSINKFNRSGPPGPFQTGTLGNVIKNSPNNVSSITHTDSTRSLDYLVPTLDTYIGTTTIARPTGALGANTGNFFLTDSGFYPGGYSATASLWVYPVYADITDNFKINASGAYYLPYTGGAFYEKLRPKFIDAFVANQSPAIRASGFTSFFPYPYPAFEVLDLGDPKYLIEPAVGIGLNVPISSSNTYIDYVDDFSFLYFSENNWTQKSQSRNQTEKHYYDSYGDNYAFLWVENIDESQVEFWSFKVNGNYIFQNVTGIDKGQIDFKVGPNNLVYMIKGTIAGDTYTRYGTKSIAGDFYDWLAFNRHSASPYYFSHPPTESAKPEATFKIQVTDLNGNNTWGFTHSSFEVPYIFGVTSTHFYVEGLMMRGLPSTTLNRNDILTEPAVMDTDDAGGGNEQTNHILWTHGEPQRYQSSWRIDLDGTYFSSLDPMASTSQGVNISNPPNYGYFNGQIIDDEIFFNNLDKRAQKGYYDKTMITNNSQITKTPVAHDNFINSYSIIDYDVLSNAWNPTGDRFGNLGAGAYELITPDLTGNNWTAGSDVYIGDTIYGNIGNSIRLNTPSSGFTGTDVAIYKHLPVETGHTYVLQLKLSTWLHYGYRDQDLSWPGILPADNPTPENPTKYFDLYVTHSGVKGSDGLEVQYSSKYFYTSLDRFEFEQGLDNINDMYFDGIMMQYTPIEVSGTGYNPLTIKITSSEEETFNWNKNYDPQFLLRVIGMAFYEAISGTGALAALSGSLQYPAILEYNTGVFPP